MSEKEARMAFIAEVDDRVSKWSPGGQEAFYNAVIRMRGVPEPPNPGDILPVTCFEFGRTEDEQPGGEEPFVAWYEVGYSIGGCIEVRRCFLGEEGEAVSEAMDSDSGEALAAFLGWPQYLKVMSQHTVMPK